MKQDKKRIHRFHEDAFNRYDSIRFIARLTLLSDHAIPVVVLYVRIQPMAASYRYTEIGILSFLDRYLSLAVRVEA